MRGKLRDKRADAKRYSTKREQLERRRPAKRDSRTVDLLDQQWNEDDFLVQDEGELVLTAEQNKN